MNAPWNGQEREWLQALGHDVLVLAGKSAAPESATIASSTVSDTGSARGTAGNKPTDIALMRAVLRAAGRREVGELAAWLPDPASLRGNAAAKRALWPRLRALRRKSDA